MSKVLPPLLAQLQAEHPALTVELVLSNRVHDLLQREADIAIRMTEPRQDALIARRVGTIPLGLYAHPSYIAARGTPATLAELAHHRLIGFDAETPFLRAAQKACPRGGETALPCAATATWRSSPSSALAPA